MTHALLLANLSLAGYAVSYVVGCVVFPFTACHRCTGSGKRRSPGGRAFGLCGRCAGSGRRVRTGRRMWTWITGEYRNSNR